MASQPAPARTQVGPWDLPAVKGGRPRSTSHRGSGNWWRWLLSGVLVALLLSSNLSLRPAHGLTPAGFQPPAPGSLRVGTMLRSIDSIDLVNNSFEADFYLWTLWSGDPDTNPSGSLTPLNAIYNGDIQRFEEEASQEINGTIWTLYAVHSRFIHRWQLDTYPFDSHELSMQVGFRDPLEQGISLEPDSANSGMSPELYLYGWNIGDFGINRTDSTSISSLGKPNLPPGSTAPRQAINSTVELIRRSSLHLVPDFLGYILAVGLCVLALLISRTRDDLILAAVVSAAGNYVYLAGILPVGAMSGFIGRLQLVILAGVLYVVGADEIIDHQLGNVAPGLARFLRLAVLPSYLLFTMVSIYLIIPTGVLARP